MSAGRRRGWWGKDITFLPLQLLNLETVSEPNASTGRTQMLIDCWLKRLALGFNISKNKNPRSKIPRGFRATTRSNHGSKFTALLFFLQIGPLLLNAMSPTLALFTWNLKDPYSVEGLKLRLQFPMSSQRDFWVRPSQKCVASKNHHSKNSLHPYNLELIISGSPNSSRKMHR